MIDSICCYQIHKLKPDSCLFVYRNFVEVIQYAEAKRLADEPFEDMPLQIGVFRSELLLYIVWELYGDGQRYASLIEEWLFTKGA